MITLKLAFGFGFDLIRLRFRYAIGKILTAPKSLRAGPRNLFVFLHVMFLLSLSLTHTPYNYCLASSVQQTRDANEVLIALIMRSNMHSAPQSIHLSALSALPRKTNRMKSSKKERGLLL